MAWTQPPRTWADAELVTASIMNTHVRDQLSALQKRAIPIGIGDVTGDVITTGTKAFIEVPFAGTITGWTLLANAVGSIVIDVWKDTYANFPPVVADTIAGSEKPTLSAVQKNQDLTLTTWTTSVAAGDVLAFNVDSATTVKQVTLGLRLQMA